MNVKVKSSKRGTYPTTHDCYYINTIHKKTAKPVSLNQIKENVKEFLKYAKDNPLVDFKVLPFKDRPAKQVANFFFKRTKNVILPKEFRKYCRTLEERFLVAWRKRYSHLPQPERQYQFHPERKWKADFAWPKQKVIVEVQGGAFVFGGHNRGGRWGQQNDYDKQREAVRLGWKLLPFNTADFGVVDSGNIWHCVDLVATILCKMEDI